MINLKMQNFIAEARNFGNLRESISKFTTSIEEELRPYIIPSWEVMDLQVEENFEASNSIYLWLNEQLAKEQPREVRIDFRGSKFSKVNIHFIDDSHSRGYFVNDVDVDVIGTVEFLASTARWFRDLIEPKILYTAVRLGIDCKTI